MKQSKISPEELLKIAEKEGGMPPSSRSMTWPYQDSVHVLRKKGWTWRRLAVWLEEQTGLHIDHKTWADNYFRWAEAKNVKPYRLKDNI